MAKNPSDPQDDVTGSDDTDFDYGSEEGAVKALLKKWGTSKDDAGPSEGDDAASDEEGEVAGDQDETEVPEETADEDEAEAEDTDDTEEAEDETPEPKKRRAISDEDEIEYRVDGKTEKVTVGQLKRLAGQEASLTRKSQDVAALRQQAEQLAERSRLVLQKQIEKAKARRDELADVDLVVLARDPTVSDNTIRAIRMDKEQAEADYRFFSTELDELVKNQQSERVNARNQFIAENAPKARIALEDPKSPLHIPKFQEAYPVIMEYAVRQGMSEEDAKSEVNPVAISVLWKAMKYDAGKAALTTKAKPKPAVKQAPSGKTVARPGAARDNTGDTGGAKKALNRFRDSGDVDSAVSYYLKSRGVTKGE